MIKVYNYIFDTDIYIHYVLLKNNILYILYYQFNNIYLLKIDIINKTMFNKYLYDEIDYDGCPVIINNLIY